MISRKYRVVFSERLSLSLFELTGTFGSNHVILNTGKEYATSRATSSTSID